MHSGEMNNIVYSPSTNLVDVVIDEVALEGLDGITIEALWTRLLVRLEISENFPRALQQQVWSICKSAKGLIFYELDKPRNKLILYDRYEYVDPDLGIITEPDDIPKDLYDYSPIDDLKNGIRGSCSTYTTRTLIDNMDDLTLDVAESNYGQRLVIVGSQQIRDQALIGDTVSPTIELNVVQYCFLERVGRARYHGEVTQGKRSLAVLKEDPKSLFYYRKILLKHKLITKQNHYQKNSGHGTGGSLLHLPRFYVERKPKLYYLAEKVISILKTRENCLADYKEIRQELQLESSIKRLFKTSFFQKVVRTDLLVPYRVLYPQADTAEWSRKSCSTREKKLRAVQLLDPHVDASDLWNKDTDVVDDEEIYELDVTNQLINVPILKQANCIVEASRDEGVNISELAIKMGLPKLQARTILRNLSKLNLIGTYMNDVGRQRITKYVSKKFEKNSEISKQYHKEVHKMKELTKDINVVEYSFPGQYSSTTENFFYPHRNVEVVNQQEQEKPVVTESDPFKNIDEQIRGQALFGVVNKLFKKYNINKYKRGYDLSFNKVSEMKDLHVRLGRLAKRIRTSPRKIIKLITPDTVGDGSTTTFCNAILEETNPVWTSSYGCGEIKSLMKDASNEELRISGGVTYRILKRANMIIEAVKEHKVIDDTTKLMKMINEEEEREGYDVRIDKKSLIRLLQKLAGDNLVKNIKLTLSANGKKKSLTFICDPSINVNHSVIQSAVEQARIKFCLTRFQRDTSRRITVLDNKNKDNMDDDGDTPTKKVQTSSDINIDTKLIPPNVIFDHRAGKKYGYSPKFIRMQILHQFLFYLIYDHPGASRINRIQQIYNLRTKGYQIDEELESEMGEIYNTQVGWKMFIPPLPTHSGWPSGWALMCDVLLRIPLSIFLKIYRVSFFIPDLDFYLNHSIRKHYLIKDLPILLRNALLLQRKYIFSIHQIVTRLCYINLVQFGPQKLKEKDQVFIYLNRRSELMDTTTSAAGYHQIEEKEYPVTRYYFDKMSVVEKYWYDMWHICVNTQLGGRLVVQGTEIVLEELTKKPEMVYCLTPKHVKEAAAADTGYMPGDKKGAAGIDSAFFSHLKRNWNWDNFGSYKTPRNVAPAKKVSKTVDSERKARLSKVEPKPIKFTECTGLKKSCGPTTVNVSALKSIKKSQKPINVTMIDKMLRGKLLAATSSARNPRKSVNAVVRKVLPRKKKERVRVKYDDVDYSALKRMNKLRVDWDPREDNILLVCKVVMMYLCPNPRSQLISFPAVRDVLRTFSVSSFNKTSRACQRRLLYMLKQPQTVRSVALGVEEIKQNYYVNKKYGDVVNKIRKTTDPNEHDEKIAAIFKNLVAYVAKKYYDLSQAESNRESLHKPKTLQEFNLLYQVNYPAKPFIHQGFTNDVKNVNEIHMATINSVIYSSMCCGRDRRSWAYQLFRIYQQYPEILLRNAMAKIRADGMVSIAKHYLSALKKYGHCLPISSSQYQLSTPYLYKFHTKLPLECYSEIQDFLATLIAGYNNDSNDGRCGVEVQSSTGGLVVGIQELMANDKLDFNIELPDHVITLDPKLQECDETYIRIAKRYQDILLSLESTHMDCPRVNESNNANNQHKKNKTAREEIKQRVQEQVRKSSEVSASTSKSTSSNKHSRVKRYYWGWYHVKQNNVEEQEFDENLYFNSSDDDDDDDNIKFQDGTLLKITKDDIEWSRGIPVDQSIHDAFLKTHGDNFTDFVEKSSVNSLREIRPSVQRMDCDVDDQSYRHCQNYEDHQDHQYYQQQYESDDYDNEHKLQKVHHYPAHIEFKPIFINTTYANVANTEADHHLTPSQRNDDNADAQKRYTRIALLKMREELSDDVPDSHHAHEYFAVNAFGIRYLLPEIDAEKEISPELTIDEKLFDNLLSLNDNIFSLVASKLTKFSTFPRQFIDYSRVKEDLDMMEMEVREEEIDLIYDYVRNKKEQGATLKELTGKFYKILGDKMFDIFTFMTEQRLFLRSGVTEMHYIHYNYVDPWLIQSIRIMRLQRETLPRFPPGSFYVFNSSNNKNKKTIVTTSTSTNKGHKRKTNDNSSTETAESNGPSSSKRCKINQDNVDIIDENDMEKIISENQREKNSDNHADTVSNVTRKSYRKNRTCLLQTKDIYTAAKRLDLNTAEDIRVVIRPWIQIDGVINKSMLEKMLGAVLAHCVMNPGINLSQIQTRFIPALQPYHIRELVELLVNLECLQIKVLRKHTTTLFSKSSTKICHPVKIDGSSECEDEIIVESAVGATIKFGAFFRRFQSRHFKITTATTINDAISDNNSLP